MIQMVNIMAASFLFVVALSLLSPASGFATTSKLQFTIPKEFRREDGYDHREALFGLPPYGGAIQQNVYYADSTMCDANFDYKHGGYPERSKDSNGKMAAWKSPFILLVDRGECTFVIKVRNAQKAGATSVLIADNTCLCSAGDACQSEGGFMECETKEPIMADDGTGGDITVPSFLIFKQDADPIKEYLKQNSIVRAEMSWAMPAPDARVEYELWTTPKETISAPLKSNFREVAVALGEHAQFTPHFYVYDGLEAGCRSAEDENLCYNLCTNNGRYCATDPDDDMDSGISGAMVVTESLRQICIWQLYGDDGVGLPWWDYIEEFEYRCDKPEDDGKFFDNKNCIMDAMQRSGIDYSKVQKCMDDSGGVEGDAENTVLEEEVYQKDAQGVLILPTFFVNQVQLRGALTASEAFEGICAGFISGSEPDVCKHCNGCLDIDQCIEVGRCPGSSNNGVSPAVFGGTLVGVVLCFSLIGLVQYQRSQRQMRDEVRGIMAEYMPIDKKHQAGTVGLPDDDLHLDEDDGDFALS